ncbi:Uncharacterised protein [Vibrio cholerae]|uniref:Uncharacterized protein n=1 Tax=Vibrio cholerae TaxID=666 RepID=A0A655PVY4_VIBCL|nr:Uncharacterised protein [Vibrio cholerae]CSA31290.1 Uncharacterised protein [Vibrio cholerae]CSB35482.1 Uncharacterised protein [Vibrio cholerae]CSB97188.1 Uncharacterised protein [Vibrio cholerae]CSC48239.1 Uncharacterised protein [Vibrio cholerae]
MLQEWACTNRFTVSLVILITQPMQQALLLSLFKGEVRDRLLRRLVNTSRNTCIMRRNNLRAVFPIHFKSVVFRRVVACGYYNCGGRIEMAYAESHDRGRRDLVGQIGFDAE